MLVNPFFQLWCGENGTYTAKLPIDDYHAEAFGFDPENGTPYNGIGFGK